MSPSPSSPRPWQRPLYPLVHAFVFFRCHINGYGSVCLCQTYFTQHNARESSIVYLCHVLIRSFVHGHSGCGRILTIVNNAAVHLELHRSLQDRDSFPLVYTHKWDYWITFNVLRNLHAVFHNGCPNSYSHQQSTSVIFSAQP